MTKAALEAKTMALSRAQHEVIMLILLYCSRIYLPCWICFHFPFRCSTRQRAYGIAVANCLARRQTWRHPRNELNWSSFAWKRGVVLAYLSTVSRTLMFLFLPAFVRTRSYSKAKMRNSKNVVRFLGEGIEWNAAGRSFRFPNCMRSLGVRNKAQNKEFIQRICQEVTHERTNAKRKKTLFFGERTIVN